MSGHARVRKLGERWSIGAEPFTERTPDFREAEVHHAGGGEARRVTAGPPLVKPPAVPTR